MRPIEPIDRSIVGQYPPGSKWVPHRRETWPWRICVLTQDHGSLKKGTKVKIVMVSRLGDVGITQNLTADYGYTHRVPLSMLEQA